MKLVFWQKSSIPNLWLPKLQTSNLHYHIQTSNYLSSNRTFLTTNEDAWGIYCAPTMSNSPLLEHLLYWRNTLPTKRTVSDEQHQVSCNRAVMNVNQQGLMQRTAASGRAACRVMRLWLCAGTRLWSFHLAQELCWGNKGERHWPLAHSLHKQGKWDEIRERSLFPFSSLPTHSFSRLDGFLVGGPAECRLSRLLPYEALCLNMSTVIGNSFFILKAENRCRLTSKSQS